MQMEFGFYFLVSYPQQTPVQYGPFRTKDSAERYKTWIHNRWQINDCGEPEFSDTWGVVLSS